MPVSTSEWIVNVIEKVNGRYRGGHKCHYLTWTTNPCTLNYYGHHQLAYSRGACNSLSRQNSPLEGLPNSNIPVRNVFRQPIAIATKLDSRHVQTPSA